MNYILFSIFSALIFALTFFFRRTAIKSLSIPTAYFFETIIQLIILAIIFFIFSPELKKGIDLKNIGIKYVFFAGVTITIGVLLNYFALKTGAFSKVISITSPAQIMFGVLLGVILIGDAITIKQFIGIILGISGILLITL